MGTRGRKGVWKAVSASVTHKINHWCRINQHEINEHNQKIQVLGGIQVWGLNKTPASVDLECKINKYGGVDQCKATKHKIIEWDQQMQVLGEIELMQELKLSDQ